ncbi:hypothetical protein, partial [Mycoplasma leonicaptivi]|uniref:hypothetical protein n=1 Tax=Mycoplasma leonicaptivi TaxID=36742 RepID=UPI000560B5BF
MKKISKFKFIFTSALLTCAPLSAVSCLYENDKTVVYSKEFSNNNWTNEKTRFASSLPKEQQIPALIEFENKLYDTVLLNYSLTKMEPFIQGTFIVNNDHIKVTISNSYIIGENDRSLTINQNVVNSVKDARVKQELTSNLNELKSLVDSYYAKQLPNQFGISKIINSSNKSLEQKDDKVKNTEKRIKSLINIVDSLVYWDTTDPNKVITKELVEKVVENFVKDTPFYAYYLESLDLQGKSSIKEE